MPKLTALQYETMAKQGRMPQFINAAIWFGGNELKQKTPGKHHLPEFQEMGTYNHPEVIAYRTSIMKQQLKSLAEGSMNSVTFKNKIGNDIDTFLAKCEEHEIRVKPDVLQQIKDEAALLMMREEGKAFEQASKPSSIPADNGPTTNKESVITREATTADKLLNLLKDSKLEEPTMETAALKDTELFD